MIYLLLTKFKYKVLGIANDREVSSAENFFRRQGYTVQRINAPPTAKEIALWEKTGLAQSSDGCYVRGLESCQHGHKSWLAIKKDEL